MQTPQIKFEMLVFWFAFIVYIHYVTQVKIKSKAILVAGGGGPWCSEMSKLPPFLGNRLTDRGEVVSFTRTALYTRKISGTYFC
jgi:hypothetical protein